MRPDFLVVGHIVKDMVRRPGRVEGPRPELVEGPDAPGDPASKDWVAGGGVYYAAAQAKALGLRVAAVTRCSADIDPSVLVPGVEWHVIPDQVTTSFENVYLDGHREQRVTAVAQPLRFEDVPSDWRGAPQVLLAPVFHDVVPSAVRSFAGLNGLVGVGAQGWLRRIEDGRVQPGDAAIDEPWLTGDVVFVSEEDLEDPHDAMLWRKKVHIVVLTNGVKGCTVWYPGGVIEVPGYDSREIDATGAGDAFAAAFLVRLRETSDAREAARFGAAAGALAVRAPGIGSIGNRTAIDALMSRQASRA